MVPTIVEAVARTTRLYREEVFGPVTILEPFDSHNSVRPIAC